MIKEAAIPRATARQRSQISLGSTISNRRRLEEDWEGRTFTRKASSSTASTAIEFVFPHRCNILLEELADHSRQQSTGVWWYKIEFVEPPLLSRHSTIDSTPTNSTKFQVMEEMLGLLVKHMMEEVF